MNFHNTHSLNDVSVGEKTTDLLLQCFQAADEVIVGELRTSIHYFTFVYRILVDDSAYQRAIIVCLVFAL